MIPEIFFYVLAATAVLLALAVISARNPVYSAVALVGCLLSVAGIFALNSAHFLALLQILVYAGAIMVLILFVIMLLNLTPEELGGARIRLFKVAGAFFLSVLGALLIVRLGRYLLPAPKGAGACFGTIEAVGKVLYRNYLLPFEMVSLLLLAAILGAVVLTRKEKKETGDDA